MTKASKLKLKLEPEDVWKPSRCHHENHLQQSHLPHSEFQHVGKKFHTCYVQHMTLTPTHMWHPLCECFRNVNQDFYKPAHPQ